MHDCNPANYYAQIVPRMNNKTKNGNIWNGDVWKAWVKVRHENENLEMFVVDTDFGCGIIRNGKQEILSNLPTDYYEFEKNKKYFLNLISEKEFLKLLS